MLQVIIFDDAGYIAGVQSVLLERDVDMSYNDLTKQVNEDMFLEKTRLIYIWHSRCTCKTCGWARWHGSPRLTLSTPSSSATVEGHRSDHQLVEF